MVKQTFLHKSKKNTIKVILKADCDSGITYYLMKTQWKNGQANIVALTVIINFSS